MSVRDSPHTGAGRLAVVFAGQAGIELWRATGRARVRRSDAGSMPAERLTTAHFAGRMSKPPLPGAAVAMLRKPNPAVITTLRRDGQPEAAATWYLWDDRRVLVSMDEGRKRLEHLRNDPRVAPGALDGSG
jgi:Pyridoxamine 5'-phosphate oxidase